MKKLIHEPMTIICDTREQLPLKFPPQIKVERATLHTGDYSVKGLTNEVVVERKSLQDFIMCVGRERERFNSVIERMTTFRSRAIVIEGRWEDVICGNYRGETHPNSAIGSVLAWQARQIPVIWAVDHECAGHLTARFLYLAAKPLLENTRVSV